MCMVRIMFLFFAYTLCIFKEYVNANISIGVTIPRVLAYSLHVLNVCSKNMLSVFHKLIAVYAK